MYVSQNPMAEITVQIPKVRKGSLSSSEAKTVVLFRDHHVCSLGSTQVWTLSCGREFHNSGSFHFTSKFTWNISLYCTDTYIIMFPKEMIREGSPQNCKYMCMNTNDTSSSFPHRQGNNEQCEKKYPRVSNNSSSQNG